MASPFPSGSSSRSPACADQPAHPLHLLVAPAPALSGDGQLRELIQERRIRLGAGAGIWYLHPDQVVDLALGRAGDEAVAAVDSAVIVGLELRFGGHPRPSSLSPAEVAALAPALPPLALPLRGL